MNPQILDNKINPSKHSVGPSMNPLLNNHLVPELKPSMRGIIHLFAFIFTSVCLLCFSFTSYFYKFDIGVFIYIMCQLIVFGVSASYHIPNWNPRVKNFMRFLDHICIPILISGTQTSVLLNLSKKAVNRLIYLIIKATWVISVITMLRIIFIRRFYDLFDVACYSVHGLLVIPIFNLLRLLPRLDIFFMFLGGVFYLIGGTIYILGRPNPIPSAFGFHEIFHVLTVLGNGCFAIIIAREYISLLLK